MIFILEDQCRTMPIMPDTLVPLSLGPMTFFYLMPSLKAVFPKTRMLRGLGQELEEKTQSSIQGATRSSRAEHLLCQQRKLVQHTTPIANTHGTAMFFASEPTENLKMLINVRHRNITNHDQNITAASPPVTETPKHHRHRAETSPTQNQGIIHISPKHHNTITTHHRDTPKTSPTHPLKIAKTSLAHAENILTHHQRITETSPRYHQIIHETKTKHNRDLTQTSPKHHQDTITKTSKKSKHHHQSKKKQHSSNINDTTPSHHPLIIKTSQHHHQTSRRLHRNMPETSPTHH